MLRKLIRVSLAAALGMIATMFATAQDKKDDRPDVKEIMRKGHARGEGYIDLIRAATKAEKWDDAQKYAKLLASGGEVLGKNKVAKGDPESWKSLCEKYATATKTALKGTEDKDSKLVAKGLGAIACGDCHKLHK